jgi:hypothetical protein
MANFVSPFVVVGEDYCAATEFNDYGWMDEWMDGWMNHAVGRRPSSGFVVPGGPSVILIDFSPAFKK